MCGIFGYIGKDSAVARVIDGLKHLEYRGYDSAGIAGLKDGELVVEKHQGKINQLEKASQDLHLDIAIGHTRWATHGIPNDVNAHPHHDERHTLAVVHNGIIENYVELKQVLNAPLLTETDTEVVAALAAQNYHGDLHEMLQKTIPLLEGSFALAMVHKDHPDTLLAIAYQSPLAVGRKRKTGELFLSSDPNTFADDETEVYFLADCESAILHNGTIDLKDAKGNVLIKEPAKITSNLSAKDKKSHETFMHKEIFEQTEAIQATLDEFKSHDLTKYAPITFIGCGSSFHAGRIGASLVETHLGIPSRSIIASEFRYSDYRSQPNELFIAISQSGETADTLAAIELVKDNPRLGICNVPHSSLTRLVSDTLYLKAGPEISVCSTKAFSAQVALLSDLILGQESVAPLPTLIDQALKLEPKIRLMAEKYARFNQVFFLGRQLMYPTAMEGALKLKEISYVNANAYPAGELKHGPIALVNPSLAIVGLLGSKKTYEKTVSNIMEVKARGGQILLFAPENSKEIEFITEDVIYLPEVDDALAPIPYSVALQLFAYHVALLRGTDIDQPRNLAKSVTVE